ALTPAQASKRLAVRLIGIVIDRNSRGSLTIMDDTAGIYVGAPASLSSKIQRGDLIELTGVSNPGRFAPFVQGSALRWLGKRPIPEPRLASRNDLISGQLDAQWIEVSGVVRRVERDFFEVELDNGGGRMQAHAPNAGVTVDSTVRLRGVCYYQFNVARQMLRPYLAIPAGEAIEVKESAVTNLDAAPVRLIESLMQFSAGEMYVHRVRLHGVVIYSQPRDGFWLHDSRRGIHVLCDDPVALPVGTEVHVMGFVGRGDYSPVIEDAVFQKTGKLLPVPLLRLRKAAEALNHDADVVQCEAVVEEQWSALDGWRLKLNDGSTEFAAILYATNQNALASHWLPGTRVRITGVSTVGFLTKPVGAGTRSPDFFQLLLRSPADVEILQLPSWWNAQHMAWLAGAAAMALLAVVAVVIWIGHRRLRAEALERMKSEAQFSAIWNERNRLARELHDTLAQGLGAISLQLEVAKRQLPPEAKARPALEEAGAQTRASLQEVRNAIWNMRAQVLETGDLVSALHGVLKSLTDGSRTQSEVRVVGKPRRLAPRLENNLLRIGQEAITNAAKHAGSEKIEVLVKFEAQQLVLIITDNGRGFDPTAPPASAGGMGLKGMCERAAELNGQMEVESAPGKGCTVKLTVPTSMS
ncbi:MAG TPA: sensor histidine kinase, partial [Verrucomicrobiae bacterium]